MQCLQACTYNDSSDDDTSDGGSIPELVSCTEENFSDDDVNIELNTRAATRPVDICDAFINTPYLVDDYDNSSDEEDSKDEIPNLIQCYNSNSEDNSKQGSELDNKRRNLLQCNNNKQVILIRPIQWC